jgi:predicted nucleotidyltransferase
MNKIILKNSLKRKLSPILRDSNVSYCALFGSRSRNDYKKSSDYDFVVDFYDNKKPSLFSLAGLKIQMENKLKKPVDLAIYGKIKPSISPAIKKDLLVIYEKR